MLQRCQTVSSYAAGSTVAPANLSEIKAAIAARQLTFPPALERVARDVICNPDIIAFESAAMVARRCRVATATVSRLATHLGFQSFREMKAFFQRSIASSHK